MSHINPLHERDNEYPEDEIYFVKEEVDIEETIKHKESLKPYWQKIGLKF
jgi:hypothetical protein